MTANELRSEIADARGLMAQVEEIIGPVLEELEDIGGAEMARRARRLNEVITEAHEELVTLEDEIL